MYENIRDSKYIAVDIETFDPLLLEKGPGVYRSIPEDYRNPNGFILGVSLYNENGAKGYYNLGHYDCAAEERERNLVYLRQVLSGEATKIGQNFMYDVDWLENWGNIKVNGKLIDIMIAESLLDENQGTYNLDFMGKKYLKSGKANSDLAKFCISNGLPKKRGSYAGWLYRMPYYLAVDYAIQDVAIPIKVWAIQQPMLEEQNLTKLMEMECSLLRPLIRMRKEGVPIDNALRKKSALELSTRVQTKYNSLINSLHADFNFNSAKQIAPIFNRLDIEYPLIEKTGNPSVKRDFLLRLGAGVAYTQSNHELIIDDFRTTIGKDLADVRRAEKILKTFINGSLIDYLDVNSLIHCSFNNTMTDDFGARSGRFSSSNPNLQQIPSPNTDAYYGNMCRRPFIPLEDCWWGKLDYSQIEYRFMAHFAVGRGAQDVRDTYNANPKTDYHKYIQDLTGLARSPAKRLNFGVGYGMGRDKMADSFQWTLEYTDSVRDVYFKHAPFIKATSNYVSDIATRRGYIKTFLDRRSRLVDKKKAYAMYCRLMQGSAADLMKKAMVDINNAGILDELHMHITVHDEIDVSIPKTKAGIEAFKESKYIMENCIKLDVPIIADMEIGENWADVKEVEQLTDLDRMLEAV